MSEGGHHHVTGIGETGEDHLERRESENLHTQMIKGEDHPHPTGTTQIIYPPKEMTEEFGMIDFTRSFHQTEDPHSMTTSEIDLRTLTNILHMTLLLTHPTLKREGIQVKPHKWRKSQRLFLLTVY